MRLESAITLRRVVYNKCCKGGKVYITPFKKPPLFLSELLRYNGPSRSREFTVDRSVNDGTGPNIYKINGQVCHRMGSLMPKEGIPLSMPNSIYMIPRMRCKTGFRL